MEKNHEYWNERTIIMTNRLRAELTDEQWKCEYPGKKCSEHQICFDMNVFSFWFSWKKSMRHYDTTNVKYKTQIYQILRESDRKFLHNVFWTQKIYDIMFRLD